MLHLFCLTTFISASLVHGYSTPNVRNAEWYAFPGNAPAGVEVNVGQCTWYVYGRIQETGLISHQQLATLGIFKGKGSSWYLDATSTTAKNAGITVGNKPRSGAIACWSANHVAFVEDSYGNVTESNNKPASGSEVIINGCVGFPYVNLRKNADSNSQLYWKIPQFTLMKITGAPLVTGSLQYNNRTAWYPMNAYDGNTKHIGWAALLEANTGKPIDYAIAMNFTRIKRTPSSPWIVGQPLGYIYLPSIAQSGSLSVTINPANVVSAGAKWQVDGKTWQNSGAIVSGLSVGDHQVAFNTIPGYTTPSGVTVTIAQGSTLSIIGNYTTVSNLAQMTSPVNGSTFGPSSVTFTWSSGSGVSAYYLFIGNVLGDDSIYSGYQGSARTCTISNIPVDGRIIYVSLWSYINNNWQCNNYTYKACNVLIW